jgi:hypothetical protein
MVITAIDANYHRPLVRACTAMSHMHVNTVPAKYSHFRNGQAVWQACDYISMCAYEDASGQLKGKRGRKSIRGIG